MCQFLCFKRNANKFDLFCGSPVLRSTCIFNYKDIYTMRSSHKYATSKTRMMLPPVCIPWTKKAIYLWSHPKGINFKIFKIFWTRKQVYQTNISSPWKSNKLCFNIKGGNLKSNNAPLTYLVSVWLHITNIIQLHCSLLNSLPLLLGQNYHVKSKWERFAFGQAPVWQNKHFPMKCPLHDHKIPL